MRTGVALAVGMHRLQLHRSPMAIPHRGELAIRRNASPRAGPTPRELPTTLTASPHPGMGLS